ncbi:HU family DNA-binding protein [Candidatus Aerophobetes bacterium]|uniref:HU family DNA-binding protein n=1 Tax=Aerophobetes bacterium TaxID=2030807 RepID=A0A523RXR1_UNCAE|nr:MAG: HU family DNA-binding protein [Candidatus Aerophobetes bacterium]
MNKAQLVEKVADEVGLTKKDTRKVVDAVTQTITEALSGGEKITLVNFGTFRVRNRKSRKGRNPQTGEKIQIPAKKVVKFEIGKGLREVVK